MTSLADRQLEQWKERMAPLGRLPAEWIGKTPEAMPPPRIRDRIVRAWGGRCADSGVEIVPGVVVHMDHIIPLSDGGMNAERNLQPLVDKAHRAKTRQENRERATAAKKRRAAAGNTTASSRPIQSAPFPMPVKKHRATSPVAKLAGLPLSRIARMANNDR